MQGLSQNRANHLLYVLQERGIEGVKKRNSENNWSIFVGRKERAAALETLSSLRLTKDQPDQNLAFSESGFGSSAREINYKVERQLSRQLEITLLAIDGVLEARVHLNLPEVESSFRSKTSDYRSSGSVLLIVDKGFTSSVEAIQSIIGGAAGIKSEAISVLVVPQVSAVKPQNYFSEVLPANHQGMAAIEAEPIDALNFGAVNETKNNLMVIESSELAKAETIGDRSLPLKADLLDSVHIDQEFRSELSKAPLSFSLKGLNPKFLFYLVISMLFAICLRLAWRFLNKRQLLKEALESEN